jgi:hypothetical protein
MSNIRIHCWGGFGNVLWQWKAVREQWKESNAERCELICSQNRYRDLGNLWLQLPVTSYTGVEPLKEIRWYQSPNNLLPPDAYRELIKPEVFSLEPCAAVKEAKLVIHVRWGDFAISPPHQRSWQTFDAIMDSVRRLSLNELNAKDVVIVTDDIKAVQAAFSFPATVITSKDPRMDWVNMLYAKNLVISPGSTFSWWAGYLGTHDNVFLPVGTWPCDFGYLAEDPTSSQTSYELVPPKEWRTCAWHCSRT